MNAIVLLFGILYYEKLLVYDLIFDLQEFIKLIPRLNKFRGDVMH